MAKLSTTARKKMRKSEFGLPGVKGKGGKNAAGRGGYPMPDKKHARVAKAYASKEEHEGKLSESAEEKVDAKANRVLGKKGASSKRGRPAGFDHSSLKGFDHTDYRHTSSDR